MSRIVAIAGIVALILSLIPSSAGGISAAEDEGEGLCTNSDFGYAVRLCLFAPPPDAPLTADPVISATVELDNPDVRIRSVVFMLDGRNILSDFDPVFEFTLPLDYWPDGEHTLSAKVRLSDDNETIPIATPLIFRSGTEVPEGPPRTFEPTPGRPAEDGTPFVLAAVGDGAGGSPESDAVTAIIGSWNPNMFVYLGDVYNAGTVAEYHNWYAPDTSYGRFKSITNPTIGNHEYSGSQGPQGYMHYWGTPPNYFSVDSHGWHIVSLDTNEQFSGIDPASEQMRWLEQDLAASSAACTLVFFHHPPFSVGMYGDSEELTELWALLVRHGVTLVLAGHEHNYQRWQPLDDEGAVSNSGTVSVIVGTGGQSEYSARREDSRLAHPLISDSGALRVELNPNGAAMQFVTTDGIVRDSSVVACGAGEQAADVVPPAAPSDPTAIRNADGTVTLRWAPALDDTGIAAYNIFRDGTWIGSVPPASRFTDVTATGEPTYRIVARDGAGNMSRASAPVIPEGDADPDVVFADEFAAGSLGRWTETGGLVVEPADDGATSWIARARGAHQPSYALVDLPRSDTGDEIDLRVTVWFSQLDQGPNPAVLFRVRAADGSSIFGVSLTEDGDIGLYNDVVGAGAASGPRITPGAPHELAAHLSGTSSNVTLTVYLDGEELTGLTSTFRLQDLGIGGVQLGDSRSDRLFDIQFFGISVATGGPPQRGLDQISPAPNKLRPLESGGSAANESSSMRR